MRFHTLVGVSVMTVCMLAVMNLVTGAQPTRETPPAVPGYDAGETRHEQTHTEDVAEGRPAASDRIGRAERFKQEGDQHAAQDNVEEAARAYREALGGAREIFSPQERLRMSVYLSWADFLDEALFELERLKEEDPDDLEARVHLARVLSWKGRLADSIREADEVLSASPDDVEARLVKADALQWQGRHREAIPVYQAVLERGENFQARKGLAYSLLEAGDRKGAVESSRTLEPVTPRQQREATELSRAIDRVIKPKGEARYQYYQDSDGNALHRYGFSLASWLWKVLWELDYRHTDARDHTRGAGAEDLSLRGSANLTDRFSAGGGLGYNQLHNGGRAHFLTGSARADLRVLRGSVGARFSSEMLSDTAELIGNGIRSTAAGVSVHQALTQRFSLSGGYAARRFSDSNKAHDVAFASHYAILADPRVVIGYRLRFLDFERQTGSGYFDPNGYVSNRFFNSLYLERESFYVYAEYFLGHQHYERYGVSTSDFVYGGSGSLGLIPAQAFALELNVEGGNFAPGAVSGFTYLAVGLRVFLRF